METEGAVKRITLDVPVADYDFLKRLAAYRNKLAKEQDIRLDRQWSRKSVAEAFLVDRCNTERSERLGAIFESLGPIPDAKDRAELEKYVRRVIHMSKGAGK